MLKKLHFQNNLSVTNLVLFLSIYSLLIKNPVVISGYGYFGYFHFIFEAQQCYKWKRKVAQDIIILQKKTFKRLGALCIQA